MNLLADKGIRALLTRSGLLFFVLALTLEAWSWLTLHIVSLHLLLIIMIAAAANWILELTYFRKQARTMEQAVAKINAYLDGDVDIRIECDEEGTLYQLFHAINSLAAVLSAHIDTAQRDKMFLKRAYDFRYFAST